MIPIDLSGKVALVTGVGDNEGFAWYISKALRAAGARIVLLIHSVAYSREIMKPLIDTSRKAYHEAMGVSAYSLVSMVRSAAPYMANRPGGASVVGLTYVAGDRVVPHYGGGMGTCKAALQIDAKQLAWFVGDRNIRVNLISAGPYASRAARAINKDFDKLITHAA